MGSFGSLFEPWAYDVYEWDLDDDDDFYDDYDEDDYFDEEEEDDAEPADIVLPPELEALRDYERRNRGYGLYVSREKAFYEQARDVEDFACDYEGTDATMRFGYGNPTYATMTNYQLLRYFDFRTRFRRHETPDGPVQFFKVLAYELIDGIGAKDARDGYDELCRLRDLAATKKVLYGLDFATWIRDYVLFWDLDASLVEEGEPSNPNLAIVRLMDAENALLKLDVCAWPSLGAPQPEGLPDAEDLLDALSACSRYHAEKSRFFKDRRQDAAQVTCRVFARMVDHCHKRRKVEYVEGLVGTAYYRYTLFDKAPFYTPVPHADVTIRLRMVNYRCEKGFWYRQRVPQMNYSSRDLGDLIHAIDCTMREATGYPLPLKARSLHKYQRKYVDQEVSAYLAERKAYEAKKIHIDRASLKGIRRSSIRTREALLTDEERAEVPEALGFEGASAPSVPARAEVAEDVAAPETTALVGEMAGGGLVSATQADILQRLLSGEPVKEGTGPFLSLEIDAINEAFLDIVDDTVIEFSGDGYVLVEDYADDVREALAE